MSERMQCVVPFCRRSRRTDGGEWICAQHWRLVPPMVKAAKFASYRVYRRKFGDTVFWKYPPGSPERIACVEADRACRDSWEACKAAAIERAVGIV